MTDLDNLIHLQDADSSLDAKTKRRELVRASIGVTVVLREARNQVDALVASIQDADAKQRALESTSEDRGIKIKELETKLYSGTVKNTKELSALQHEITHMKESLSDIDGKGLEAMETADQLRASLSTARERLDELEAKWKADQTLLKTEYSSLGATIETERTARKQLADVIAAPLLVNYEDIRKRRGGLAVARIERNTCMGCRTTLATMEVQAARQRKIAHCSSCGRILSHPR